MHYPPFSFYFTADNHCSVTQEIEAFLIAQLPQMSYNLKQFQTVLMKPKNRVHNISYLQELTD